jgi:ferredoxin
MTWKIDNLQQLVDFLASRAPLYGPASDESGRLKFGRIEEGGQVDLSRITEVSARVLFQPMTHFYLSFENHPSAEPQFTDMDTSPRIVFGLRPCDVAGLRVLDRVLEESDSYRKLRDSTAIIGYLCDRREPECFCESVGGSPVETSGMDLAIYPSVDGSAFLLMAVTEKGRELMEGSPFPSTQDAPDPVTEGEPAVGRLPEDIRSRMEAASADDPAWAEIGFPCVNCRVCTYVCPTCHCFTITDEVLGSRGGRAAVWDSCQAKEFTLEASGHNPRETASARVRQRLMHKFSYWSDSGGEGFMCSGCGRCISGCPTGRSILEDLSILAKEAG